MTSVQCKLLVFLISTYQTETLKAHFIHETGYVLSENLNAESSEVYTLYTRQAVSEPVIPEVCGHLGICDTVPNYPNDLAKKILQQSLANGTKFNQDTLEDPTLDTRISEYPDDIDLCASIKRIFAPRAARNEKNEWNYILNNTPNPVQTFHIELCNQMDAPCLGTQVFNIGYRSRCVQKYMLRKTIAFNERNEIFQADFKVPSSCSCMIR